MSGHLLIEAIVVGVSTVVMGNIIGFISKSMIDQQVSLEKYMKWDILYTLQVILFLTGLTLHIIFEILGLNGWYCNTIYKNTRK